jgi:PAS domain S-box-containing protein
MDILNTYSQQELLDKIGVIVLGLDRNGRVIVGNRTLCELVGYEHDELIGLSWLETFILPEDRAGINHVFSQVVQGAMEPVAYYENAIITRNGEVCIMGWHNTLLQDEQGRITGIFSTGEDITARVEAEQKIRESEHRYRRFVEHVPDALIIHDRDGKIIDVNNQACKTLQYTRAELLSLNIKDIDRDVTEEERADIRDRLARAPGVPVILQRNLYCKDGSPLPLVAGSPTCNTGFAAG